MIPYGVKFNFTTIADAIPRQALVIDYSMINDYNNYTYPGTGNLSKSVGIFEGGDPTARVDMHFKISSGHHPTLVLDNRGTAGSTSADQRIATILWTAGFQSRLDGQAALYGPAPMSFSAEPPDARSLVDGERRFARQHAAEWIAEREADEIIARQRSYDSDIWVVEVEDRSGNSGLDGWLATPTQHR